MSSKHLSGQRDQFQGDTRILDLTTEFEIMDFIGHLKTRADYQIWKEHGS